jgi:hypothetical protein
MARKPVPERFLGSTVSGRHVRFCVEFAESVEAGTDVKIATEAEAVMGGEAAIEEEAVM